MHNLDVSRLNHTLAVMSPLHRRRLGAVITLQAVWRSRLAYRMVYELRKTKAELRAAIALQSAYRMYKVRKEFHDLVTVVHCRKVSEVERARLLQIKKAEEMREANKKAYYAKWGTNKAAEDLAKDINEAEKMKASWGKAKRKTQVTQASAASH